jgi:N-acetylglucosaminyl-diphospho-decaprenol L-rhamnosyltransferase
MDSVVVIPTLNGRALLAEALEALHHQSAPPADVFVVDNASTDGTADMVRADFPDVHLLRNETNLGFGRAINRAAFAASGDVLVLVNNDVVCDERFLERIAAPLAGERGIVAGVLTQWKRPELIDSAGIVLDRTLRSWDHLAGRPVAELSASTAPPFGPCGGAAAFALSLFQEAGGFDEHLFAYWEDVDMALRLREAGATCALAHDARALHRHSASLGARSKRQAELDAFGRGYVLGKYAPLRRRPGLRALAAAYDWPVMGIEALVRRQPSPLWQRLRGARTGAGVPAPALVRTTASVSLRDAVARQWASFARRSRG